MVKIRVFVTRDEPLNLGPLNLVTIDNATVPFDIKFYEQRDDNEPQLVDTYNYSPDTVPPGPEPGPEPPQPQPEPEAALLWDSNKHGQWNNGKKRLVTDSEGSIKPNGKGLQMRASGKPRLEILGDGSANLICDAGHGRFYTFATNFNSRLELEFALSKETDNLSLKLRSRHQEGGDGANRFGGYGCSIALTDVGMKREDFHNVHSNSKSKDLPQRLKTDTWYGAKFSINNSKDNKQVNYSCDIDFKDGKGFKNVLAHTDPSPKPYMIDKKSFDQNSYFWVRQNNEEKATIRLRNIKLIDLDAVEPKAQPTG